MKSPLVSISLVVYNQEDYLAQAIESCLMQKVNFDYEIIIHDDKSSDRSSEIILDYAKAYPDIIIPIIQQENQFSKGTEVNAYLVIPRAKGKYIAFLEADDYWIDEGKLQYQVDFLENNPHVAMCFTATKRIFQGKDREPEIKRYRNHHSACSIKDIIFQGGNLVDMGSAMIRASVFEDLPDWYSNIQVWDITMPLLSSLHGEVYYLNRVTSVYRYETPGSWTQTNVKNIEKRKNTLVKSIKTLDEFDDFTNFEHRKLIRKKNEVKIIELLLLSSPDKENKNIFYPKLSLKSKLIYNMFKLSGSLKLWNFYRYLSNKVAGI